jgi:hypothetical protein
MNNFKQQIEYLAHAYIAIAKRERSWDRVKELIERNQNTADAVKKRIKELYARNRPQ